MSSSGAFLAACLALSLWSAPWRSSSILIDPRSAPCCLVPICSPALVFASSSSCWIPKDAPSATPGFPVYLPPVGNAARLTSLAMSQMNSFSLPLSLAAL
ncbi:hypothetical protein K491DRAFT_483925 [Lophiostoma macrostomum CBS 122681]|uniref:Secreted protein n=1 Tax=Lophiostoma macrostomum CBS 122681 TaxID=1314788 RepID=A0A6A6TNC7_9PLEO|nr:hypothetical protein K491DRAFT_483925 [Lophiostoma macrostomum CBS 122681]